MNPAPSPAAASPKPQVLLVECADRPGLVHGITGVLYRSGANVVGNQEFVDRATQRFFMRTEFDGTVPHAELLEQLGTLLPEGASVRVADAAPKRVVVLVTREHHCLADILVRHTYHELNARVLAVVGNHADLGTLTRRFDLPFHHVPHEGRSRAEHEAALLEAILPYQPDFLVLAKFMRVLGPEFIAQFPSRIINIHHSFLPAFAGARPYHQAFDRGVKVIGATAHFVTEQLDEGPILVQHVIPVDHTHTAADLQQSGRDVEQLVLSRALRLVFEDRVFLCGHRTVIFD